VPWNSLALTLLTLFAIALAAHVVPFSYIPTIAAVTPYVALYRDPAFALAASFALALGSTAGKLVVFFCGHAAGKFLLRGMQEEAKALFNAVARSRGIGIAIFIFAATPLPDDVLYIPLAVAGYDVRRFALAVFAGKLALYLACTLFIGGAYFTLELGAGSAAALAATLTLTVTLSVLVARISWPAALAAYREGGLRAALRMALRSAVQRSARPEAGRSW
jgi:membrane protein YqaA with SNARE-associated domain